MLSSRTPEPQPGCKHFWPSACAARCGGLFRAEELPGCSQQLAPSTSEKSADPLHLKEVSVRTWHIVFNIFVHGLEKVLSFMYLRKGRERASLPERSSARASESELQAPIASSKPLAKGASHATTAPQKPSRDLSSAATWS